MRAAVCLDAVFHGTDTIDAMRRVLQLGYRDVELWSWWDRNMEQIHEETEKLGLRIHAICTKFIPLTDSNQHASYREGLAETIEVAKKLNCKRIITQVGAELQGLPREEQHRSIVAGLRSCVPMLEAAEITLSVEPLNVKVDHEGYFLYSSQEAFDIIREVGSEHIKILYDLYHQMVTEGDVRGILLGNLDHVAFLHAAGCPGRHELDTGDVDYGELFKQLRNKGYDDIVTLEYFPKEGTEPTAGLKRFADAYPWMLSE